MRVIAQIREQHRGSFCVLQLSSYTLILKSLPFHLAKTEHLNWKEFGTFLRTFLVAKSYSKISGDLSSDLFVKIDLAGMLQTSGFGSIVKVSHFLTVNADNLSVLYCYTIVVKVFWYRSTLSILLLFVSDFVVGVLVRTVPPIRWV